VEPSEPAVMILSTTWSDNGENTTLLSLYSCLENKCLAIVKETLARFVNDSSSVRRVIVPFLLFDFDFSTESETLI
jgi:hypothetical protein